MKRLLFILSAALICMGQGFGPKIVKGPMPSKTSGGGGDLMTLGNMAYWWIGTNAEVAQSTTTVTNWPSIAQASLWTNANSSIAPTKSGSAVVFASASSQYLTNAGTSIIAAGNGEMIMWILKPTSLVTGDILCLSDTGASPLYWIDTGGDVTYYDGTVYNLLTHCTAARITDVIWYLKGGGGLQTMLCYTNGVQSFSGTANGSANPEYRRFGRGNDGPSNCAYYELAIWTNIASPPSATIISNVHYYATNTYSFTP